MELPVNACSRSRTSLNFFRFPCPGSMSGPASVAWSASPDSGWASIGGSEQKMSSHGWSGNAVEDARILDAGATIVADAERGGRVSRKERMTRPRHQDGCLWIRGKRRKVWVLRWREDLLLPDGSVKGVLRAETLGPVSKITRPQARQVLHERLGPLNLGLLRPQATMTLEDFVRVEWKPNAELALKKKSVSYYESQLDSRILPALGSICLCSLSRAHIEGLLSDLRRKGETGTTLSGVRATLSTVLRSSVARGYRNQNPAHGIRLRGLPDFTTRLPF